MEIVIKNMETDAEIKGKAGEAVAANADLARLSRRLAEIRRDAPIAESATSFTIGEGVTFLGAYFISGTRVGTITVPSTVTTSGTAWSTSDNGALAGCAALTEVIFAPGTQKIPAYICASPGQTSYLETVVIPDSVVEIGSYAFNCCVNLKGEITIPRATKTVGTGAFLDCKSITGVTTLYNDTVEWNNTDKVEFSATIKSSAFRRCTGLSSLTLAGSVKVRKNAKDSEVYVTVEASETGDFATVAASCSPRPMV